MLFGEPPGKPEGKWGETVEKMKQFAAMLHDRIVQGDDKDHRLRKAEIYTLGLIASLDELEQSRYAAQRFAGRIASATIEEMTPEETLDYKRYVYFDKNAFIRLFAVLDKLGTLLNVFLGLGTERIKVHFSYFTVIRTMRQRGAHPELSKALNELKEGFSEPMGRLRKRRNTEIHYMNPEMQDDLAQNDQAYGEQHRLENLQELQDDLSKGLEMVLDSLRISFDYTGRLLRKRTK